MAQRYLVVDLRASGVSLGLASSDKAEAADGLLLTDGTGRTRLPLSSPSLWVPVDDDEELVVPHEACVGLVTMLLAREERGRRSESVHPEEATALKALLTGLKQYAESRLEKLLDGLVVLVLPCISESFRAQLRVSGDRAGFATTRVNKRCSAAMAAYKIDKLYAGEDAGYIIALDVDAQDATLAVVLVEDGVFEPLEMVYETIDVEAESSALENALNAVLERSQVSKDQLSGVVLIGELSEFQTDDLTARLEDLLPRATIYSSIPAPDVAVCGAVEMAQHWMEPVPSSTFWCCLQPLMMTIGLATEGGMATPLVRRGTLLPCGKTSRFSVYCDSAATTSVELRFCEGERVYARDNTALGLLTVGGLDIGWNEVDVRVDVSYELEITIEASVVSTTMNGPRSPSLRLQMLSPAGQMSVDQFSAYFEDIEAMPTLAQEETERGRVHSQQCTEELIRSVSSLLRRPTRARVGQVFLSTHAAQGPYISDFEPRASTLLDGITWGDEDVFSHKAVHDALLDLLGGQIVWKVFGSSRCPWCVVYEDQRRRTEPVAEEDIQVEDVILLPAK